MATLSTLREEVVHELGTAHARVRVQEAEDGRYKGNENNFDNGVVLDPSCIADVPAPAEIEFGEVCAINTLSRSVFSQKLMQRVLRTYPEDSEQKEREELVCVPVLFKQSAIKTPILPVQICAPLTLSYVTWNRTSLPLPNGSKKRSVTAATIAQKKLPRYVSPATRTTFKNRILPPPHDLRGEEVRHLLKAEQDATNGCTERDRNSGRTGRTEDPTTLP